MASMTQKPFVIVEINLTLREHEARALVVLSEFDHAAVLKLFADNLTSDFANKHSLGMKDLLAAVRKELPPILRRADDARAVFDGKMSAAKFCSSCDAYRRVEDGKIVHHAACPKADVVRES
jgi:hypothetical protein